MDLISVAGIILAALGLVDEIGGAIVESGDTRYAKLRGELFAMAKDLQGQLTAASKKINSADARNNYYKTIISSHPLFNDVSRQARLAAHNAEEEGKKARANYEEANRHLGQVNNAINSSKIATSLLGATIDQATGRTDQRTQLAKDALSNSKQFLEKGGIQN